MPIYNRSVSLDNTAYFDGAMIDNIPVFPLMKVDLDYIICVYFDDTCYKFENTCFDNKVIKITFPSESVLKQSLIFKQESIEEMIASGYCRTECLLKTVFAKGYDDLEYIYRTVDYLNHNATSNGYRVTGDVLVTNLNKITQRLTKRKII